MKIVQCIICNKDFKVHNYREKTAKYCSRQCMGKDVDSNWSKTRFQNNHKAYNLGVYTCKKRNKSLNRIWAKKVKEIDKYICQRCGSKDKLISHHKKNWDNWVVVRKKYW